MRLFKQGQVFLLAKGTSARCKLACGIRVYSEKIQDRRSTFANKEGVFFGWRRCWMSDK
jgi:hypothetical protein